MYSVDRRVGRLFEVRIVSPVTLAEAQQLMQEVVSQLKTLAGSVVACTDVRGANVFPPEVAAQLTALLRADNPKIERSAFYTNESAVFSLQLERMIREAAGAHRRTFRAAQDLAAWLKPGLTGEEAARLAAFLAEPAAVAPR